MNSNKDDEKSRTGGSRGMPLKPKMNMDDEAEEVTRKIAPSMIMPSLGPMPTMPISMSSPSTYNTSPMKSSTLQKQRHKTKRNSTPFTWKLSGVPVLPEFHQLERTATFVPNAMPAEVASRISDVLRERSIEARYENGKAKVKCTSLEGVDFRVRLYRGRGRYNHGIIVEVQRRFGTSLVFHNDTQSILDGARGEVPAPPSPLATSGSILPEVSEGDDEDFDEAYPVPNVQSSLGMVTKIMKLSGFDSQNLGLQMLSPLVDSEKLSLSTARAVATTLFEQESEVGDKVFDYVVKNNNRPRTRGHGAFDDDEDDDDSAKILRNASICILANAIKAYGKVPEYLRDSLRPALLRDLRDAEDHPNTAFLSAKCLEFFIAEDHYKTELNNAFEFARQVGEARHANLMHQAQKCIDISGADTR